jgi:hypothetical protein
VALRHAATLWGDLQDAVARQSRVPASLGSSRKPQTLHGPVCRGMTCDHASCEAVWKSRNRALSEPPIPNEAAPAISFHASEDAFIVGNTITTWARLVSEESGDPIPNPEPPEPQRADPVRIHVRRIPLRVYPSDRPERCDYSDLPVRTCACGRANHHQETA